MSDASNPIAPGDDMGEPGRMPDTTLGDDTVMGVDSVAAEEDTLSGDAELDDGELTPSQPDRSGDASEAVRDPAPGLGSPNV
jgi:hypothetical protein